MAHIERRVHIEAPVEEVYRYASDVGDFTEWWPSLVEISNHPGGALAAGQRYRWSYRMMGIKFRGTAEVLEAIPNDHYVVRHEGALTATIRHDFHGEGTATDYTLTVDYQVPGGIFGRLLDRVVERSNEREADRVIHNLKGHCERKPPHWA